MGAVQGDSVTHRPGTGMTIHRLQLSNITKRYPSVVANSDVSLTVAVLFLAALAISPLAGAVPAYATAPALFFVACLMLRDITELDWDDTTEVIPAAVTALAMPFTYSIANGLAFGFITYAVLKLFTGRARQVHWMVWLIGGVFLFKFIYIGGH